MKRPLDRILKMVRQHMVAKIQANIILIFISKLIFFCYHHQKMRLLGLEVHLIQKNY